MNKDYSRRLQGEHTPKQTVILLAARYRRSAGKAYSQEDVATAETLMVAARKLDVLAGTLPDLP